MAEVARRTRARQPPSALIGVENLTAFTRAKVEPMVRGIFPRSEQDAVMHLVERSVVFLTPSNIEDVLRQANWLQSAWDLANLYLGAMTPRKKKRPVVSSAKTETNR